MLPDDQLQKLADDITANGLRDPIVIDVDERIVDGRNRSAACVLAGVDPTYAPFVGSDAEMLSLVISSNLHRRHLTESQRAMVAAELVNIQNGHNQHKQNVGSAIAPPTSSKQAAATLNVSTDSVKRAKKVKSKGTPELQEAVSNGEVSVSRAAKIAELPKPEQNEAMEAKQKPPANKPPKDAGAKVMRDIEKSFEALSLKGKRMLIKKLTQDDDVVRRNRERASHDTRKGQRCVEHASELTHDALRSLEGLRTQYTTDRGWLTKAKQSSADKEHVDGLLHGLVLVQNRAKQLHELLAK